MSKKPCEHHWIWRTGDLRGACVDCDATAEDIAGGPGEVMRHPLVLMALDGFESARKHLQRAYDYHAQVPAHDVGATQLALAGIVIASQALEAAAKAYALALQEVTERSR